MRFLVLATFVLAVWLTACGSSVQPEQIVSNISIQVEVEPAPPAVGEATLLIKLTDDDGTPIDGAIVSVHGDMDHEGMISIDGESNTSLNGEYQVPFTWTMGGGWIIDVTAQLPDNRGLAQSRFEFFVDAISTDSIINRTAPETTADASREFHIIIPEGTNDLIEAGQEPNVIPNEIILKLGEQNILVIQNNDTADHFVGPFFVRAGESIRQEFTRPEIYEGGCSIHRDAKVRIIVEE